MPVSESLTKRVVVVHQMGKVGSIALYSALQQLDTVRPFFTHMLNRDLLAAYIHRKRAAGEAVPEHARASNELWRVMRQSEQPIDLISAVRDPLARNISAMFQNLPKAIGLDSSAETLAKLTRRFLLHYPHSTPINWFDRQLNEPLGLDVYRQPFDHERGRLLIQSGRLRALVLRAEDPDQFKQQAVRESLGLDGFMLARANEAANKPYAGLYREFVSTFEPPSWLSDKIYRSACCEHFYTADEIGRFRNRWAGSSSSQAVA